MSFVRPLARAARASGRRFASSSSARASASASSSASATSRISARAALTVAGAALAAGTATYLLPSAEADAAIKPRPGERVLSLGDLVTHAAPHDLWIAIDGRVYDVSEFSKIHPGGLSILTENGGTDVTRQFHAIHKPGTLEKFASEVPCVGVLDAKSMAKLASQSDADEERIQKARAALFGVDSVVGMSDFERYAKDLLPSHAWWYYSTGADSEATLKENFDSLKRIFFRPRVMRDVSDVDPSVEVLGYKTSIPVFVSPTARNAMGQPEGEVAVTRGAGNTGIFQVLSHYASRSLEEVKAACREGQQVGWQLYLNPDRSKSEEAIREAVAAGAHSIWITADTTILGKRETERRLKAEAKPAPNGQPLSTEPSSWSFSVHDAKMSWDDIAWVRKVSGGLPVVVKGVGAWEDVVLAYKHGADAVVISNHGARQLDYAQPPIKVLYDVNQHAPQVLRRPNFGVFIDSGLRSGTDVLKALCLGATACGMGRPFIFAATGWGSDGVTKAVQILEEEIVIGMKLLGVTRIDQLGPQYLDTSKL